jgi:hypothetical protein
MATRYRDEWLSTAGPGDSTRYRGNVPCFRHPGPDSQATAGAIVHP